MWGGVHHTTDVATAATDLDELLAAGASVNIYMFHGGTNFDTATWGKGYAFVNGFFLGRYWRNGPQRTLYVPAPITRQGKNTLVVRELEEVIAVRAVFVGSPMLGVTEE